MPAKRANKMKGKSGKKKPAASRMALAIRSAGIRKAPRKGAGRSSGGSLMLTAPASVSSTRKSTIFYGNTVVNGQPALRVSATVPIAQIGDSGTYNNGFQIMSGTTAYSASSMCMSVLGFPVFSVNASSPVAGTVGSFVSPHIPLLALAFDKYSVRRLAFHCEPQAATSVSDRLVFSWTEDAAHPFLGPINTDTQAAQIPTQLDLLVTKDSVAFAPWRPWSLPVPVDSTPRFTFTAGDNGTQVAAELRLSTIGALSCVSSAGSAATYGILYASMEVDLIDPVPLFQTVNLPSLLSLMRAQRKAANLSSRRVTFDSKEEKGVGEDDPVVLSPGLSQLAPATSTVGWFGASPAPTPAAPPPLKKASLK